MAPLISLCCMIVCLLSRTDNKAQRKLKAFTEAAQYQCKE